MFHTDIRNYSKLSTFVISFVYKLKVTLRIQIERSNEYNMI